MVVTAEHRTDAVGLDEVSTADPLVGGIDVRFSVSEAPDHSILPPSSTFAPDRNPERYEAEATALDARGDGAEASSAFTHPDDVDPAFLLHDLGVVEVAESIELDEHATLPAVG